jgi:hypothetical protein
MALPRCACFSLLRPDEIPIITLAVGEDTFKREWRIKLGTLCSRLDT